MVSYDKDRAWTDRDLEILESLALKVRMFTASQIGRTWWPESSERQQVANARSRLRRLERAGLVARYVINAHPLITLAEPICSWEPGEPEPRFQSAATRLQNRWLSISESLVIFTATRKASNLFGGYPVRLSSIQVTHDVHLSEVFVNYRISRPEWAARWLGEDAIKRAGYGIKEPDAFVLDDDGEPETAVEFGGKYAAARVRDFHEHCFERGLPYEIW